MCVNIEIILPTIENFLLLYSLRCGTIVILCWTTLRALFCVIFFTTAILELLIQKRLPFGAWLMNANYQVPDNLTLTLFYLYIILVICNATLLVFISFLGYGIYLEKAKLIKYYLMCRFLTWVVEVLLVSVLCLSHKFLIGYYLSILLFIVLEFYSFIVVYSYFVTISELENEIETKNEGPSEAQELCEEINICHNR